MGWQYRRYDPTRAWSDAQAAAIHDASCQRVLALFAHRRTLDAHDPPLHARLITDLRERFDDTPRKAVPPPLPAPGDVHVLVFDGESHGNARLVPAWFESQARTLAQSAATSKAHRFTTHNQAEYYGLIAGLQAAADHRWPSLEVVSDSALILRQPREYQPPKNARLLRLYLETRTPRRSA